MNVQVNVVSLSAGIYILQNLSQQTCGHFCLARNKDHLDDLMERFLVPSEYVETQDASPSENPANTKEDDLQMEEVEKSSMI